MKSSASVKFILGSLLALAVTLTFALVFEAIGAVFASALVNTTLLCVAVRVLAPLLASPAMYFSAFLTVNGYIGSVAANSLADFGGTGGVHVVLTEEVTVQTARLFLFASSAVLAGALATNSFTKHAKGFDTSRPLLDANSRYLSPLIVFMSSGLIVLIVIEAGPTRLLQRSEYLLNTSAGIGSSLTLLSMGATILLGVSLMTRKPSLQWLSMLLIALFCLYFVSLGSRRLALVPVLIFIGIWMAKGGRPRLLSAALTLSVSVALLALPLHFRAQETHGVIPHLLSIPSANLGAEELAENANNVLVGFRITGITAFMEPPISMHSFWTSVSPLPGKLTDWYLIAENLRINKFTPYSALGEVGNHGYVFAITFFLILGVIFGLVQRINWQLLTSQKFRLVGALVLCIFAAATLQPTQYNLRSNIRLIYYASAIAGSAALVQVLAFRRRNHEKDSAHLPG